MKFQKVTLFFLLLTLLCISCSVTQKEKVRASLDQVESSQTILSDTLGVTLTQSTSYILVLKNLDQSLLSFRIRPLETGVASSVSPLNNVDILDNSTYGYPDDLTPGVLIDDTGHWSRKGNFVLGTSVGHGGKFEGKGPRYLAFRLKEKGNYKYGWVLIENPTGNKSVEIISFGLNEQVNEGIRAGQR